MGFCPNQFAKISTVWLEEAEFVDRAFFISNLDLKNQVTTDDLSVLTDTEDCDDVKKQVLLHTGVIVEHKARRYFNSLSEICRYMSEMFIADAAAIWVERETWPGTFVLKGIQQDQCHFIENLIATNTFSGTEWPQVNINNSDSLVSIAISTEDLGQWDVMSERLQIKPTTAIQPAQTINFVCGKMGFVILQLSPCMSQGEEENMPQLERFHYIVKHIRLTKLHANMGQNGFQ